MTPRRFPSIIHRPEASGKGDLQIVSHRPDLPLSCRVRHSNQSWAWRHLHGARHSTNLPRVEQVTVVWGFGRVSAGLAALVLVVAGCSGNGDQPESVPLTVASPPSTSTAVTTSTTIPPETIDEFIDGFVGAYRTGNPVFLVQRIHPQLREFYGQENCRAAFVGFVPDDTARASIRSTSGPAAWSDVFDGTDFDFAEVYTLDIEFTDFGAARRQDMQLAQIEDRYYYFLDCGEPAVVETTEIDVALVDPDGDGLYFVHSAPSDSEDFAVPVNFRITYTGTDPTCSFALLDPETGNELVYVTGLQGGGMKRIVFSDPITEAYMSDILGCSDGELLVGPNP